MTPLIIYFIKVNVALSLLYVFYRVSFRHDTFLGLRRIMLLLICISAFAYPLLDLTEWLATNESYAGQTMVILYEKLLPEQTVVAGSNAPVSENGYSWIGHGIYIIYIAGAVILLLRTLGEFIQIYKSLRYRNRTCVNGTEIVLLENAQEPYSFFHWIYMNPEQYSKKQTNEILLHEKTHVQELHSVDILLAQVVIILCWFNPFAWLTRSEMRMNHEYLADRRVVLSGNDKKGYQYHLLGLEHTSLAAANLYNNFSVLPLKNRIKMLNRKRTKNIMRSKYLMFFPMIALLMLFGNCINKAATGQSQAGEVKDSAAVTTQTPPVAVVPNADVEEPKDELGTVFSVVEVMPEFPGGAQALMKYLSEEINYPDDAKASGTQGRVIAQFIVNKDGSISDVKVVKSVSESLDKEALRVIKEMPKWKPGMQKGEAVRVEYTVPVTYRLQ